MNRYKMIIKLSIVLLLALVLFACEDDEPEPVELAVDQASIEDTFALTEFDLKDVRLVLSLDDGSEKTLPLDESMLSAEDAQRLQEAGEHEITVRHENMETTFVVWLAKAYLVEFFDHDGTLLHDEKVLQGEDASPPEDPEKEGHVFLGWSDAYTDITAEKEIHAEYEKKTYTVVFHDADGLVVKKETVAHGDDATPPEEPERLGHIFIGWDGEYKDITEDKDIHPVHEVDPDMDEETELRLLAKEIHADYWLEVAESALTNEEYLHAIYQSRTLAVKHPEIYLQADDIFNRYLTDEDYLRHDAATWEYYLFRETCLVKQEHAFDTDVFREGDMFSWEKFDITRHQSVSQSTLNEEGPFFPFVDLRLQAMGSALKNMEWRASSLSLASFQYFEHREDGHSPFIMMTEEGDGYLSLDGDAILDDQGESVEGVEGTVVLIFSEDHVWYPLMGRDETDQSDHLSLLVEEHGCEDGLPALTRVEEEIVDLLREATALDDVTDEQIVVSYAARLHHTPWYTIHEYWEPLYGGERFEDSKEDTHFATLHANRNAYIARLSNYLNPYVARLAAVLRQEFAAGDDFSTIMPETFDKLLDRVETYSHPREDFRMGWLRLWDSSEHFFWNADDILLTKGNNCLMSAAFVASVIDVAEIEGMYSVVLFVPGHAYTGVYYEDEAGVLDCFWWNEISGLGIPGDPIRALNVRSGWVVMDEILVYHGYADIRTSLTQDETSELLEDLYDIDSRMRVAVFDQEEWEFDSMPLQEYLEIIKEGEWDKHPW